MPGQKSELVSNSWTHAQMCMYWILTVVTVRQPPRPSPGRVNYNSDDDDAKSSQDNSSTLSDKASELSTARSQVPLIDLFSVVTSLRYTYLVPLFFVAVISYSLIHSFSHHTVNILQHRKQVHNNEDNDNKMLKMYIIKNGKKPVSSF